MAFHGKLGIEVKPFKPREFMRLLGKNLEFRREKRSMSLTVRARDERELVEIQPHPRVPHQWHHSSAALKMVPFLDRTFAQLDPTIPTSPTKVYLEKKVVCVNSQFIPTFAQLDQTNTQQIQQAQLA